jgi:hypothetical protein
MQQSRWPQAADADDHRTSWPYNARARLCSCLAIKLQGTFISTAPSTKGPPASKKAPAPTGGGWDQPNNAMSCCNRAVCKTRPAIHQLGAAPAPSCSRASCAISFSHAGSPTLALHACSRSQSSTREPDLSRLPTCTSLLLHCQPPKALGKTFAATSTACSHTYDALYCWTPACITAPLGRRGGLQEVFHWLSRVLCPAH